MGLLESTGLPDDEFSIGIVLSKCCRAPWIVAICSKSFGHAFVCSKCGKTAGLDLHILIMESMGKQLATGMMCEPSLKCPCHDALKGALQEHGIVFPMDVARKTSGN